MNMDVEQMELDVLLLLTQWGCYVSPNEFNYDTRKMTNEKILASYNELLGQKHALPTVDEVYHDIRLCDWRKLHEAAVDVVDMHAKRMNLDDQIYFYDMHSKDTIENICFDIEKYTEQAGYKFDTCQYIKEYITGFGYAICIKEDSGEGYGIIAGDAQNYFEFGIIRGNYMSVGKNILTEITKRGGVLIG